MIHLHNFSPALSQPCVSEKFGNAVVNSDCKLTKDYLAKCHELGPQSGLFYFMLAIQIISSRTDFI